MNVQAPITSPMYTVDVINVDNKGYLVNKQKFYSNQKEYYLNGTYIDPSLFKYDFYFSKDDKFQYKEHNKITIGYTDGVTKLSVEEYKSKNQYYDEDSTEEDTLRAIANRKELKKFVPIYEEPTLKDVQLVINGFICDTGSKFIDAIVSNSYKYDVLFTVHGQDIAMDEYKILSERYKEHGHFQKPDRHYLRFVNVNHNYVFKDKFPFGDHEYLSSHQSLDNAKKKEQEIRDAVRTVVLKSIFKEDVTEVKKLNIIAQLEMIQKMKSTGTMSEAIDVLITDLKEYKDNCFQ